MKGAITLDKCIIDELEAANITWSISGEKLRLSYGARSYTLKKTGAGWLNLDTRDCFTDSKKILLLVQSLKSPEPPSNATRTPSFHKRLKAVIGYWTDYYYARMSQSAFFKINNQKVSISYNERTQFFELRYKWLVTPVHYDDIFDTLDLYEALLKDYRKND